MKIHTIYKNTYRIQAFSSVSIFYPRTDFTRRRNIRFPLRFKIFSRARVRIVSAKFPMAPGQTVQTEEKIFTNWGQGTILSKILVSILSRSIENYPSRSIKFPLFTVQFHSSRDSNYS